MYEEEFEKFNDSYIDIVNKEYEGDKYENGVNTERRPPPTQYGRNQGGRDFRGDHKNYAPSQGGNNGHAPNPRYGQNFDQRDFRGDHRNYAPSQGGNNGQGPNPGYGQNFEQRDFKGDHSNYLPSQGGNYQ
ncbi:hypothetical protein V6N13_030002 [Hibiscus sabdariffa]|uniref:Uncharacterized protein n=1 Tax=Hibiscus sabdariffa TaxID=183260 RepID=A0ABR2T895_9ROSI